MIRVRIVIIFILTIGVANKSLGLEQDQQRLETLAMMICAEIKETQQSESA